MNTEKEVARRRNNSHRKGKLSIVGIGPGNLSHLTQKARDAIDGCEVIVGYNTYIKLLGNLVSGKQIVSSGMTQEVERANQAIEAARAGKRVCLVSSGDPGVYGMAGIALELLDKRSSEIEVEIIPGVIAATACAASLGAALMHDFAVISLSDLLTDRIEIEKRIESSTRADFVIVLYNPQSRTRKEPLEMAWRIVSKYRSPETPVGIVRNAGRSGEKTMIVTLKEAPSLKDIDMVTTIIVGNSNTYVKNGYMITPRGYKIAISKK